MVDAIERVNILGVGVSAVNMEMVLRQFGQWIVGGERQYVVLSPVYTIMRCHGDEDLRAMVNEAGMVAPDGMPVVLLTRRLGQPRVGRVYGPDLLEASAQWGIERSVRHYFYGGHDGVAKELARVLAARYPGLITAGAYEPPVRDVGAMEDQATIDAINAAQADIVWVGLGSPKQDVWMAQHRDQLTAPILIGVGAAFDLVTGRIAQAPRWMQRNALEWLFRLVVEPRRLMKRYLVYNPLFVYYMSLQLLGIHRIPLTGKNEGT